MEKIIEYLKQLELSELEAKLYLTLLQTGPISVRELAEKIDIKRTTAYLYIDQLVEKGLVLKLVKGSKKLVAADDPNNLHHLVDEKIAHADEVEKHFPDILKTIITSIAPSTETTDAEIKYYKGKNGIRKVYEEALSAPELRLYANLTEMARQLPLEADLFEQALSKNKDLKIFEIVADDPASVAEFNLNLTSKNKRYQYKFIPTSVGLVSACILLYASKVAIVDVKENASCVVLYNNDYYTNSKKLFDFIWSTLPEINS